MPIPVDEEANPAEESMVILVEESMRMRVDQDAKIPCGCQWTKMQFQQKRRC